ncbi:MAG TPA: histidine kinase dimerization/phospho-acceptor domain-containing protein, partial [Candidatus Thermoplasmatota archaeon]|nr:histidine kinase dimerization/phospho-acceptor domain-containing protein [Candidatus Thermoplasmatota archaeon]
MHRSVLALAALAIGLLAANSYALFLAPPSASWGLALGTVSFVVGFAVLERVAVSFAWRSHRNSTAITEFAVYLGLVLLSPHLVVLLVPVARVAVHLASRRSPIKGVFNVAHQTVAAGAGAATYLALATLGWEPLLAAAVGTVAYSLVADLLLAVLFGLLEGVPPLRVYLERLAFPNALALATGVPAAIAFLALYRLHPLATLAALPLLVILVRHASLQARADRELIVRRRLADEAHKLVGTQDEEAVAREVLRSALAVLDTAGRVRLTLEDGRSWEEDAAPVAPGEPGMSAPVTAHDGARLGTLEAWERPMKPRFGEDERALLQVVAGKAAHSIDSARALAQVAAQRDLIARQEKLSALGTLLAGVAHEVNNPLSYMRLRLQVTRNESEKLLKDEATPEESKAYARKMLAHMETLDRGVDRLAGLSHSLKVVARPGDG